jgi:hypothetical protein
MAGLDKIDPANPCLGSGAALPYTWQRLQVLAERLCDFFENACARTRYKKLQRPENVAAGRSGVVSKMHVLTL